MIKHVIKIADASGHSTIVFDQSEQTEVETAAEEFERLAREGHQIFRFAKAGGEGEANGQRPFDPTVEKYLIMPRAAGG